MRRDKIKVSYMKKLLILFLIGSILSGCGLFRVHKLDIEQGNIITPEEVRKLHYGMSESQVKQVMGNPVLINLFSKNRLDYVYTFQPGYGRKLEKRLVLMFRYGVLREIQG